MNDLSGIQQLLGQAPPTGSSGGNSLGQQDFLKLMITQLQNQDPFKPMENGDFLGQMAQFSTVSGIQELQQTFSSASQAMQGNQALQAAALVDRDVLAPGSSGYLPADSGSLSGAVQLPSGSDEAVVTIANAAGDLVARVPAQVGADGRATFAWDGLGPDGERMPAGEYRVEALARVGGQTQSAETLVWNRVDSVSMAGPDGGITLNLVGGETVALRDALEIS